MPIDSDNDLRTLWQGQAAATPPPTPQQLRARAERFESQTRRRYVRDQVSFGLVAIAFAWGVFAMDGALVRLGSAMLLGWALYGMYGLRRFAAPLRSSPQASGQTCAAHHRRQLERQRDVVRSWPLGMGLAVPGFVLCVLGFPLGPNRLPWPPAIALIGMFAFVYVATLIYGKMLAGKWQREIDGLARDAASGP
ncbi:MAG TPA: hypothetical protein VE907_03285 [Gammaproteobacteria bacterium]|nr:hypothetical protein [Gammaproteobacteria bacterium]